LIRFGTCGGLTLDTPAGCIVVASEGSGYIARNPDAFAHNYSNADTSSNTTTDEPSYRLSKVAPSNAELTELLFSSLSENVGADTLRRGTNVTAESFYSSQGRIDPNFDDDNHNINALLVGNYPTARSLEMESYWLLHLAQCSKVPIKASAAAMVLSCRPTGHVVDGPRIDELERKGGLAILQALIAVTL